MQGRTHAAHAPAPVLSTAVTSSISAPTPLRTHYQCPQITSLTNVLRPTPAPPVPSLAPSPRKPRRAPWPGRRGTAGRSFHRPLQAPATASHRVSQRSCSKEEVQRPSEGHAGHDEGVSFSRWTVMERAARSNCQTEPSEETGWNSLPCRAPCDSEMPGCTQQRGAQKHLGYLQDRRLPLETCPNGRRRDLHSDITLPDISLRAPPGMMLRFGRQPRAMRPALLGTQVSTSEVSGIVTVTSFPSSDLQSTQRSLQLCSVESQHQAWHRPGCAMQGAARGPRRGTYHVCANFVYWDSDMVMIRAWEACFPSPAVPAHIASDVWVNFVILQRVNLHVRRLVGGSWSAFLPTPLMVSARYSSSSVWFITPLLSLTILVPVLPPLAASRIAGIRSASSHLPEGAWHCSSTAAQQNGLLRLRGGSERAAAGSDSDEEMANTEGSVPSTARENKSVADTQKLN